MPKYELMYIVASTVSDDQIPSVTDGVLSLIGELGGKVEREEKLGKKKLAYPIKKTRNGFYDVVVFEMPGSKLSDLDTKILHTEGIVRHIVVNIEEMLERQAKDVIAQDNMNRARSASAAKMSEHPAEGHVAKPGEEAAAPVADAAPMSDEALDEKIEEALNVNL